jgi:hypothetical protein
LTIQIHFGIYVLYSKVTVTRWQSMTNCLVQLFNLITFVDARKRIREKVPENMYQNQERKRGRAAKVIIYLYLIWCANI